MTWEVGPGRVGEGGECGCSLGSKMDAALTRAFVRFKS